MDFLWLFLEYFKIGLFTIGGGYAMLPMVMQVVENRGWLSYNDLVNFIGIAESTPGPFAINLATFIGTEVGKTSSLGIFGGFLGAVCATVGVVLPSLIIIILVVKVFDKFSKSTVVGGLLYGIKPVVAGLILSAFVSILALVILPSVNFKDLKNSDFSNFKYISLILFAIFLLLSQIKIKGKKIHPILLIVFSGIVGVIVFGVFNL